MRNTLIILVLMAFGSPAWAYRSHEECLRTQIGLFDLVRAMEQSEKAIATGRNHTSTGSDDHVRLALAKDAWAEALDAAKAAADKHAEYCASTAP